MKRALALGLLVASQLAWAGVNRPDAAILLASRQSLQDNPVWLKLLHYEFPGLTATHRESAVINGDFFLAPTGRTDPAAELAATIQALYSPSTGDPNKHAQCRFRGRYLWLRSMLRLEGEPKISCTAFNEWSRGDSITSISVVLATGYLGNPASYYGHILLKFNSGNSAYHTTLMDESVNFGAIVPANTDPVSYITNGIFGGYDGGFSHIQYFFHTHNYAENELRDLWEYELNLTQPEVDLVTAHAWEMLGRKFRYYFFHKNCAYRMGQIIELVDGVHVIPKNPVYTIPQTLVQAISRQDHNGRPLLKSITYHPSRQSRMYRKFASLDENSKALVGLLVDDINWLDSERFGALPLPARQTVLDTLLDYYQFANKKRATFNTQNNENYRKVLARRYELPPGQPEGADKVPPSPDTGRPPGQLRIGWLGNGVQGNGVSLTLRPAYYDQLDTGPGHVSNARLTMGYLRLAVLHGRVIPKSLELMGVESVNSAITGLPGDRGQAWRIVIGGEQQNLACDNCFVARIQGDYGYTHAINDQLLAGIYAGGAVQNNRNDNGPAFWRLTLFANARIMDVTLRLSAEFREHIDSRLGNEVIWKAAARMPLDGNQSIRLTVEKNVARELRLEYGFYW